MKHECKDTDHICAIAEKYGFWDCNVLLDANNLKGKRADGNQLFKGHGSCPGDILEIPQAQQRQEPGATRKEHKFVVGQPTIVLRLRILQEDRAPAKKAPYSLQIEGESKPRSGETDEKGELEVPNDKDKTPLAPNVSKARLTVRLPATKQPDGALQGGTAMWDLRIGALNPILESAPDDNCASGVQQRLHNLGFRCGPASGEMNEATRGAIRAFQQTYGLGVDGRPSPEFQRKLQEVHDKPHSVVPPVQAKQGK